jgi:hypothetical protein
MNGTDPTSRDRDVRLACVAAELSSAAYAVALPRGVGGSWVGLELGLWKSLAEACEAYHRAGPRAASGEQLETRQDGLVAELTERACSVAVEYGVRGSLPELRSGLFWAFRSVITDVAPPLAAGGGISPR